MSSGPFLIQLPVHSGAIIQKHLEDGDKIILPNSVLQRLTKRFTGGFRSLPAVLIFEITNARTKRRSHCGVLEFSAPGEDAYLPHWMMANLGLSEGDKVQLRLRELPKVTFAKFRPIEASFSEIPDPKQTLEYALRKFTALSVDDTIIISHGQNHYSLHVEELRPQDAGCLIDTQLQVEFEAPLLSNGSQAVSQQDLQLAQDIEGQLEADGYAYYRVKITDAAMAVVFSIQALDGDPDLYVSTKTDKPKPLNCQWRLENSALAPNKTVALTISPNDPEFSPNWYWLAVHAFEASSRYRVRVSQQPVAASIAPSGSAGAILGSASQAQDPTYKQCPTCMAYVPPSQFSMHTMRCERTNWRCPECSQVMRLADRELHAHCATCHAVVAKQALKKHEKLFHSLQRCSCGANVEAKDMEAHLRDDCPLRMVRCKFCSVSFPSKELAEHERYCASKTVPCDKCGKPVARNRLAHHMAIEHNINPSLRDDPSFLSEFQDGSDDVVMSEPDSKGMADNGMTDEDRDLQAAIQASLGKESGASITKQPDRPTHSDRRSNEFPFGTNPFAPFGPRFPGSAMTGSPFQDLFPTSLLQDMGRNSGLPFPGLQPASRIREIPVTGGDSAGGPLTSDDEEKQMQAALEASLRENGQKPGASTQRPHERSVSSSAQRPAVVDLTNVDDDDDNDVEMVDWPIDLDSSAGWEDDHSQAVASASPPILPVSDGPPSRGDGVAASSSSRPSGPFQRPAGRGDRSVCPYCNLSVPHSTTEEFDKHVAECYSKHGAD